LRRKEAKEADVADDKSIQGAQDRSRVAAEQLYEVRYFAKKHSISMEEAEIDGRDRSDYRPTQAITRSMW
jgi:hypothetical protein